MYEVILGRPAKKDLDNLADEAYQHILAALHSLTETPRPRACVKPRSGVGEYRIRVGEYRVLYDVADDTRTVTILRVKHRSKAYRR
jgi:mRNA interferase RelE/StbE